MHNEGTHASAHVRSRVSPSSDSCALLRARTKALDGRQPRHACIRQPLQATRSVVSKGVRSQRCAAACLRHDQEAHGDARSDVVQQLLAHVVLYQPGERGQHARGGVPGSLSRLLPSERAKVPYVQHLQQLQQLLLLHGRITPHHVEEAHICGAQREPQPNRVFQSADAPAAISRYLHRATHAGGVAAPHAPRVARIRRAVAAARREARRNPDGRHCGVEATHRQGCTAHTCAAAGPARRARPEATRPQAPPSRQRGCRERLHQPSCACCCAAQGRCPARSGAQRRCAVAGRATREEGVGV